jgi:hypothetical protein
VEPGCSPARFPELGPIPCTALLPEPSPWPQVQPGRTPTPVLLAAANAKLPDHLSIFHVIFQLDTQGCAWLRAVSGSTSISGSGVVLAGTAAGSMQFGEKWQPSG